jgi:hypothetical protein
VTADPLADVSAGRDTFTPAVDDLVRQIDALGGWESPLARAWLREVHSKLWSLGPGYRPLSPAERESMRQNLLANLERFLAAVRDHLTSAG